MFPTRRMVHVIEMVCAFESSHESAEKLSNLDRIHVRLGLNPAAISRRADIYIPEPQHIRMSSVLGRGLRTCVQIPILSYSKAPKLRTLTQKMSSASSSASVMSSLPSFYERTPIPNDPTRPFVRSAACLIIGDEVLNGKTHDTNSNKMAKMCFEMGIELKRVEVIADDEKEIVEAVQRMVRY